MAHTPLRILQVLRAPVGGLFRHVIDLSTELANRGHEVGVIMDSMASDAQTDVRLAPLEPLLKLGVHRLPMARLLGASDITTPLKIRSLIKRLKVDIVHGHGAKGGFNARLSGRGSNVVLYTPHGGVLHFDQSKLSGRAFRAIEKFLLSRTDAMIFESAFAQSEYSAQIAAPRCPAPVIHNGLAPSEFIPVKPEKKNRDFAFIGELRDLKGLDYLLDALIGLETPKGKPATLVVAGDGPQRAEIEAKIIQLDLSSRVELVGVQPAREILAKCRCLIVPSLKESLPYVVLEASAAARPVIATRVGGIAEIFGPTAKALIPPANADALRNAMKAFLDDEAAAAKQTTTRLAHVKASFAVSVMTDAIEGLYRQALG